MEVECCFVVCDFCGYGIGKVFYDLLMIFYYVELVYNVELKVGMFFIIEFMINFGWL